MRPEALPAEYLGQRIALLTRHGKEQVIAPRFRDAVGACVEHVDGYDTDRLGSFTREVPRHGTQLEAARRKARIGMALAGLKLGVASEGAFGPDPFSGLFPWNTELVVFIDDSLDLEIVGMAHGPACHHHGSVDSHDALLALARKAGFPGHFLVVRPDGDDDPRVRKGIADWSSLRESFAWAQALSATGRVFVESDLRAHANPTRMHNIGAATDDLIRRLASRCPRCSMPGLWLVERVPGLPCAACGTPTREALADRFGCVKCPYQEVRERRAPPRADPARCDLCNP